MAIIGISGKISSGKDTCGRIIQYFTSTYQDKYPFNEWYDRVINYGSKPYSDWQIKKFAYKLKQCVSIITGIPVEDLEKEEVKSSYLGKEWNRIINERDIEGLTVRQLLQEFGTEVGRSIHPDFWINALFSEYKCSATNWDCDGNTTSENYPRWIITDMRYPNEKKAVEDRGGITIRVNRFDDSDMQANYRNNHSSETALDNATFDHVIQNDGTINDLIKIVKEILIQHQLI